MKKVLAVLQVAFLLGVGAFAADTLKSEKSNTQQAGGMIIPQYDPGVGP